jgi:ELP3 family radical SAM enzyme/protein acetyltransferase
MDIEDHVKELEQEKKTIEYVKQLNKKINSNVEYKHAIKQLNKIFRMGPSKKIIRFTYNNLLHKNIITKNPQLEEHIITKSGRSTDGVLPVTIAMRPDQFSCKFDCYMCPDETIKNGAKVDMPRSYLSTEPALLRAGQDDINFDIVKQYDRRLKTMGNNGHIIDGCKIEINILGGTFPNYPEDYRYEVMRDIYYAANTYFNRIDGTVIIRQKHSLELEQFANETGRMRIIGIIVETRPDSFSNKIVKQFLDYGVTKIQFGIQHTDNNILNVVNRKHTIEDSIKAIKTAKNSGFKVVGHFMPDLPSATVEGDKIMIREALLGPNLQVDYVKWYPCLDVEFTEIRKWKESGKWKPYAEIGKGEHLFDVMMQAKIHSQYHVRYNRIQRDFPPEIHTDTKDVVGYASDNIHSNFRQELHDKMKNLGITCKCIRCCSVKTYDENVKNATLYIDKYDASEGVEYFINYANHDRSILYGFVRLRLSETNGHISKELKNSCLIRELHVFGRQIGLYDKDTKGTQHSGLGKKLMKKAENIALDNGFNKVAVISGVGVREYYRKLGYVLEGTFMIKHIEKNYFWINIQKFFLIICCLLFFYNIIY